MAVLDQSNILDRYRSVSEKSSTYTWFNYQPINLPGYEETLPLAGRFCQDRSAAMAQALLESFGDRKLKIIDWGCNLGFFCFELAKLGHEVVGIDANRDLIDVCRYLADTNEFDITPRFYCDELFRKALSNYDDFEVAICFSVIHHLGKNRLPILDAFSATYPVAFIEMDGPGLGHDVLFPFYWQVEEIAQTDDRYGRGTRRRKTWHCCNRVDGDRYENIKHHNLLPRRGIFRLDKGSQISVVKRELLSARHSWIDTNLEHEIQMYKDYATSRFFPRFMSSSRTDRDRWMEVEFIATDGVASRSELVELFAFLKLNRLFILDLQVDSFLFNDGILKLVDLETLFLVETTVDDLLSQRARRRSIRFDTYEKQLNYLSKRLLQ